MSDNIKIKTEMKSLKIIVFILLLGFVVSCKEKKAPENVKFLETTDFKENLKTAPGVILDVRPEKMYTEAHIKDARSLDYDADNFKDELAKLDKEKPVYVYCNAGHKSRKTALLLGEMGFKNVIELKEGLNDWKDKEYPVQTEK